MIFLRREIQKTSSTIPCTEKWFEYYTCKEYDDEVNRKGYLTKLQFTGSKITGWGVT